MMKPYTPETPFEATDDRSLIYTLRAQKSPRSGRAHMVNDVEITLRAHNLSAEMRADIAATIVDALNAKYPTHAR